MNELKEYLSMRIRTFSSCWLIAALAGCGMSACSGFAHTGTLPAANLAGGTASSAHALPPNGGESHSTSRLPPFERNVYRAATRPVALNSLTAQRNVFISDFIQNFIDVFTLSGNLSVRITAGLNNPQGLHVDSAHNLWVANTGDQDVLVFPEYSMTANRVLSDASEYPTGVTMAPDGTAYVANFADTSDQTGNITVFAPGSNAPTRTLTDRGYPPYFLAADPHGNVFATEMDPTGVGHVIEYVAGKQSGLKHLPINLGWPGGIAVDPAGNLLVCDTIGLTVTEFTELGAPTGKQIKTYVWWNDLATAPSGIPTDPLYLLSAGNQGAAEGFLRSFPDGKRRALYQDPNFVLPGSGVAFMPGQSSF